MTTTATPVPQAPDARESAERATVSGPPPAHPTAQTPAPRPVASGKVRLGEELPIFCEKCGYSLHGLPQSRCQQCSVLHYACPECNHHQPINTLRPAFQKILGRLRAFTLAMWVFVKLNYFGWLLFAWVAMGVEWSYQYRWIPPLPATTPRTAPAPPTYTFSALTFDAEIVLAFVLFALPFSMIGRMLLLRWRRGWAIGLVLGGLVAGAIVIGGHIRQETLSSRWNAGRIPPLSDDFHQMALTTFAVIVLGCLCVWPAWMAIVHLFLPPKTATALLDWQRGLSGKVSSLARE